MNNSGGRRRIQQSLTRTGNTSGAGRNPGHGGTDGMKMKTTDGTPFDFRKKDTAEILFLFGATTIFSSLVTSFYNSADQVFLSNAVGFAANAATNFWGRQALLFRLRERFM